MKKFMFITAMMLMVTCQNIMAQEGDRDYSLKELAKLLVKEKLHAYDFHNGIAKAHKEQDGKILYGLINKQGQFILPCKYSRIGTLSDGLVAIKDINNKCGYADVKGNIVVPCQYKEVGYYREGLARITQGDSCAYINREGEIVIPFFTAYSANPFENGLAAIEKNKRQTFFIDKQGNVAIPQQDYRCYGCSEGLFIVRSEKGSRYGLMDTKGKMVVDMKYYSMEPFSEGLTAVGESQTHKYGFIDTKGSMVIPLQFESANNFSEGLAAVEKGGKWGFINKTGQIVIPYKYERVQRFSEGLAAVRINNKWGFVNMNGELITTCQYDRCEDFNEGYAVVKNGNQYAMIDKQGQYFIQFGEADFISSFSDGLVKIAKRGIDGYVDKNGKSTFDYIRY